MASSGVAARGRPEFRLRCASAAVLAPVAIGAVVAGGWWLAAFAFLTASLAACEWLRLADPLAWTPLGAAAVPAQAAAIAAAWMLGTPGLLGACAMLGAATWLAAGGTGFKAPRLAGAGVAYAMALAGSMLLLGDGEIAAGGLIWLLAVVWSADTGAYFVGRAFGGPKLAPRISPGKTWSGLVGAVGSGALAGWAATTLGAEVLNPAWAALLGGALGAVGQAGDLAESALKRRAGVKDSGRAIPGHGGVLDRVDALMAAAPVLLLVLWAARAAG